MSIPHTFYYLEVSPSLPVSPLAVDMQIDEKSNHVRWYNMERMQDIDFIRKEQVDEKTVKIFTNNKVFTFKILDLPLYNEKLQKTIKRQFSSDTEMQEYFTSKLNTATY